MDLQQVDKKQTKTKLHTSCGDENFTYHNRSTQGIKVSLFKVVSTITYRL